MVYKPAEHLRREWFRETRWPNRNIAVCVTGIVVEPKHLDDFARRHPVAEPYHTHDLKALGSNLQVVLMNVPAHFLEPEDLVEMYVRKWMRLKGVDYLIGTYKRRIEEHLEDDIDDDDILAERI